MNANATQLANDLAERGFRTTGILIETPDGRAWAIDTANAEAMRLFELDIDGQTEAPQEHDAIDGTWDLNDITDYLRAVGGQRK